MTTVAHTASHSPKTFVWVTVEQRCVRCGQWINERTSLHGNLGTGFCKGEGIGRRRFRLKIGERGGYRMRRPTPEERKEYAPLVAEARRTKRDVWHSFDGLGT